MISSISIVGYIGADATLVSTEKPFIYFSVACNEIKNTPPTWVKITCSSLNFENLLPYLQKGVLVGVEGKPYAIQNLNKDGAQLSVYAHQIKLFSSPRENISPNNG